MDNPKILYVNACIRGKEVSRTQAIADRFLETVEKSCPKAQIIEKNLMLMNPLFTNYFSFKQREELIQKGEFEHFCFELAWEFARADRIVIAAPLWELSFPAILRVYIENVSVPGITFRYERDNPIGMCKAKKLMYITTRGGDFSKPPLSSMEMGERHLRALSSMYGIDEFCCIVAEGLDTENADTESIMAQAMQSAELEGESFI